MNNQSLQKTSFAKIAFIIIFALSTISLLPNQGMANELNKIQVHILSAATVKGANFTLGEIAELDGFDLEQITRLAKIRIGRSPLPGKTRKLAPNYIKTRLKRALGYNHFQLNMPTAIVIQRKGQKVLAYEIRNKLMTEIQKAYAAHEKTNITLTSNVKDITLPEGKISFEIKRSTKARLIGGPSSWEVVILVDQKRQQKLLIRANVEVYGEMLVAKDQIRQGEMIQDNDLTKVNRNISLEQSDYKPAPNLVVGRQAVRTIHPNEAVKETLTEAPIILVKGSPVRVVYQTDKVYLTNVAIAMKSGREGDIIPVRTINSKKTIYAMIQDSNFVKIVL